MMKGNFLRVYAAFTAIWFFCQVTVLAQQKVANEYPQGYFQNPLGIPISLSANYGELRSNHWHMGLDMRTNQRVNLPVYAAAEGFISSIGIRPLSFGRFIIIDHPNGYSTLYAHLNSFYPELETYVQEQQREKRSWPVELSFNSDQFKVRKGALIAYSGNTGGSQGPHLHFEIRETETGKVLNPQLFGFNIADNIAPVINRLAYYDRNVSTYNQVPTFVSLKKKSKGPYSVPVKIMLPTNRVSFAIGAYDRVNGSSSNEGIYAAKVFLDDEQVIGFEIDKMDYAETVYINAQTDYKYKYNKGVSLQHLSRLPGNQAPIFTQMKNDGVIELNDTNVHTIRIQVLDASENATQLIFEVQYSESLAASKWKAPVVSSKSFTPGYVNVIEERDFEAFIKESCVYDTVNALFSRGSARPAGAVSSQFRLNDASVPVHCDFVVRMKPTYALSDLQKERTIAVREWNGSRNVRKVSWQQDWATATFSDFGNFQLFSDLVPPVVNSPARARDTLDLSPLNSIIFTPTDNFGIRSFEAELNGEWLKFSNDKGRTWIYRFDEQVPYGVHELKVRVEDIAGNVTEKKWWFKKYPYTPPKKKVVKKKKRKR